MSASFALPSLTITASSHTPVEGGGGEPAARRRHRPRPPAQLAAIPPITSSGDPPVVTTSDRTGNAPRSRHAAAAAVSKSDALLPKKKKSIVAVAGGERQHSLPDLNSKTARLEEQDSAMTHSERAARLFAYERSRRVLLRAEESETFHQGILQMPLKEMEASSARLGIVGEQGRKREVISLEEAAARFDSLHFAAKLIVGVMTEEHTARQNISEDGETSWEVGIAGRSDRILRAMASEIIARCVGRFTRFNRQRGSRKEAVAQVQLEETQIRRLALEQEEALTRRQTLLVPFQQEDLANVAFPRSVERSVYSSEMDARQLLQQAAEINLLCDAEEPHVRERSIGLSEEAERLLLWYEAWAERSVWFLFLHERRSVFERSRLWLQECNEFRLVCVLRLQEAFRAHHSKGFYNNYIAETATTNNDPNHEEEEGRWLFRRFRVESLRRALAATRAQKLQSMSSADMKQRLLAMEKKMVAMAPSTTEQIKRLETAAVMCQRHTLVLADASLTRLRDNSDLLLMRHEPSSPPPVSAASPEPEGTEEPTAVGGASTEEPNAEAIADGAPKRSAEEEQEQERPSSSSSRTRSMSVVLSGSSSFHSPRGNNFPLRRKSRSGEEQSGSGFFASDSTVVIDGSSSANTCVAAMRCEEEESKGRVALTAAFEEHFRAAAIFWHIVLFPHLAAVAGAVANANTSSTSSTSDVAADADGSTNAASSSTPNPRRAAFFFLLPDDDEAAEEPLLPPSVLAETARPAMNNNTELLDGTSEEVCGQRMRRFEIACTYATEEEQLAREGLRLDEAAARRSLTADITSTAGGSVTSIGLHGAGGGGGVGPSFFAVQAAVKLSVLVSRHEPDGRTQLARRERQHFAALWVQEATERREVVAVEGAGGCEGAHSPSCSLTPSTTEGKQRRDSHNKATLVPCPPTTNGNVVVPSTTTASSTKATTTGRRASLRRSSFVPSARVHRTSQQEQHEVLRPVAVSLHRGLRQLALVCEFVSRCVAVAQGGLSSSVLSAWQRSQYAAAVSDCALDHPAAMLTAPAPHPEHPEGHAPLPPTPAHHHQKQSLLLSSMILHAAQSDVHNEAIADANTMAGSSAEGGEASATLRSFFLETETLHRRELQLLHLHTLRGRIWTPMLWDGVLKPYYENRSAAIQRAEVEARAARLIAAEGAALEVILVACNPQAMVLAAEEERRRAAEVLVVEAAVHRRLLLHFEAATEVMQTLHAQFGSMLPSLATTTVAAAAAATDPVCSTSTATHEASKAAEVVVVPGGDVESPPDAPRATVATAGVGAAIDGAAVEQEDDDATSNDDLADEGHHDASNDDASDDDASNDDDDDLHRRRELYDRHWATLLLRVSSREDIRRCATAIAEQHDRNCMWLLMRGHLLETVCNAIAAEEDDARRLEVESTERAEFAELESSVLSAAVTQCSCSTAAAAFGSDQQQQEKEGTALVLCSIACCWLRSAEAEDRAALAAEHMTSLEDTLVAVCRHYGDTVLLPSMSDSFAKRANVLLPEYSVVAADLITQTLVQARKRMAFLAALEERTRLNLIAVEGVVRHRLFFFSGGPPPSVGTGARPSSLPRDPTAVSDDAVEVAHVQSWRGSVAAVLAEEEQWHRAEVISAEQRTASEEIFRRFRLTAPPPSPPSPSSLDDGFCGGLSVYNNLAQLE